MANSPREHLRIALALATGVVLTLLILWTSPSFQACINEQHHYAGDVAPDQHVGSFFVFYKVGRRCTGEWLHGHGETLIALFTIILGIATWLLYRATRNLVAGADETARRQLRAYVFLDPAKEFTFVRTPSTTATVEVEIHVKNLGATPAYDLVCESWMRLDLWPLPETFVFSGPSGGPLTTSVVPPGGLTHFHTGTGRPFTEEEFSGLNAGDLTLYIYGQIRYVDAFNRAHWTNFCQGSTPLGQQGFRSAMAKCDRHNNADKD